MGQGIFMVPSGVVIMPSGVVMVPRGVVIMPRAHTWLTNDDAPERCLRRVMVIYGGLFIICTACAG